MNLVNMSFQSTAIDTDFENFAKKPNNLTLSQCAELYSNFYQSFIDVHFKEEGYERFIDEDLPRESTVWMTDFLLYINIVLLITGVIVVCFSDKPRFEDFPHTIVEGKIDVIQDEQVPASVLELVKNAEIQLIKMTEHIKEQADTSEDPHDNESELFEEASAESKSEIFDTSDREFSENECNDKSKTDEQLQADPKSIFIATSPSTSDSSVSNDGLVLTTTPIKKASKNFLNINIQNVKQGNDFSHSTPRSAPKKTSIPLIKGSSRSYLNLKKPASSSRWRSTTNSDVS